MKFGASRGGTVWVPLYRADHIDRIPRVHLVHRSLAGPIGAVGGVASALAAAFGVALALRRR